MNKFIKAKVKRINAQLAQTFLPLTGRVFEVVVKLNNRRANEILKHLVQLPKEFLLDNQSDLSAMDHAIKYSKREEQHRKMNVNQMSGAMGGADLFPGTATETIEDLLCKQLTQRKALKQLWVNEQSKMQLLANNRMMELCKANPKTHVIVNRLIGSLWRYQPDRRVTVTFTESNSKPVGEFFKDWLNVVSENGE